MSVFSANPPITTHTAQRSSFSSVKNALKAKSAYPAIPPHTRALLMACYRKIQTAAGSRHP